MAGGKQTIVTALAALAAALSPAPAQPVTPEPLQAEMSEPWSPARIETVQGRPSCKSVSSCRQAVVMWCNGYRRADGDNDGIPCENVCPDKRLVDDIRREIGC